MLKTVFSKSAERLNTDEKEAQEGIRFYPINVPTQAMLD
jgi:hypothetical protein